MRSRIAVLIAVAAFTFVLAATPMAAASGDQGGDEPALTAHQSTGSPCWLHALQVIANLRAHPPRAPLILIVGNSTTREATISDATLTAAIERRSDRHVNARNISSSNQVFAKDAALVPFIPSRRTIVFIDVDLVRFSQAPATVAVDLPAPAALPALQQHLYTASHILSRSEKQRLVTGWMTGVYPGFQRRYSENLAALEGIVSACKERGLRPVLLNSPWNTAVVGRSWNAPLTRIRRDCVALASKYDIPFVNFVSLADFVNRDFYDLFHAVEPGRVKFQRLLAARTARLLDRYFPTGQN